MRVRQWLPLIAALALAAAACGGTEVAPVPDEVVEEASAPATAVEEPVGTSHDAEGDTDHADEATEHPEAPAGAAVSDASADRVMDVSMNEFAFSPESITVSAGETVQFVVANTGVVEHEFRLTSDHGVEDHMAGGHMDHDDTAEGELVVLVPPGGTGTLIVAFEEAGEVDLYACLIPGHYEAGMKGDLQISA